MRVKSAKLKDKFLFEVFTGFNVSLVYRKTTNCPVVGRVIQEIEMVPNRFGSIFVILFNIKKIFAKVLSLFVLCRFFGIYRVKVMQ